MAGNTAQMDNNIYAADGTTVLLSQQNKYTVKSGGNFRGTSGLIELSTDNTSTYTSAAANGALAGTTVGPTNVKSYYQIGASEVTNYGLVSTVTVFGASFATTSYLTPAAGWPTNPTLNTPYTKTYTVTTEATAGIPGTSVSQTETRTYQGVEQVTVPAGTFASR